MLVRFWGTRGSLPTPLDAEAVRRKIVAAVMAAGGRRFETEADATRFLDADLDFAQRGTYGGESSCVEIETGADEYVICDMGSGLRRFGTDSIRRTASGHSKTYNFFMSHLHWDHIMGFPFFVPAFDPDVTIRIFSGHGDAERALRRQQNKISFPVPFDKLNARFEFTTLTPGENYDIAGCGVRLIQQFHDNASYGYRFESGGKSVIYSTDSEHKPERVKEGREFVAFLENADLVIFDTMYSLADTLSMKEDWGHSSNIVAVDLCHRAGVKRLAMFHHEPANDDETMMRIHEETIRHEQSTREDVSLEVLCAYDGFEIAL
jgi:phosphoribosyl 1,2-cyclic phosphodiesterase